LHPALRTRACELFGVRYPVVQTGMGWVSGARLTSATSNAGGLGILASATMTYDELEAAIRETKSRTTAPIGVNLRADAPDAAKRIDLLAREGVKVASFALAPKKELIARCKDAGLVVVPSIGARRHAEKVADWGADAVIVQGGEGGGRGRRRGLGAGRRGRRPHRAGPDHGPAPPGRRRCRHPCHRRWRLLR